MNIRKKIVVDEGNKPVAVQIDIETFRKIESVLEDYALGQLIEEVAQEEALEFKEARVYYKSLPKKD